MSEIQSIIFEKKDWNIITARIWLAQHGFKPIKDVDIKEKKLRFRIKTPDYNKNYYRIKKFTNDGSIEAVVGFPYK
jgi:hypothetical protein